MESEVVLPKRRGRKRKVRDVEEDQKLNKKQAVVTRSLVLLGRYLRKEFDGSGVFLGKITYYDAGLYRVDYEDGDCEDLESGEVKHFLVEESDLDNEFVRRKEKLDDLILRKYAKKDRYVPAGIAVEVEGHGDRIEPLSTDSVPEAQVESDADSPSDSCEYDQDCDLGSEVEAPCIPPPPELPCSSGTIGVAEEDVLNLLSVYSFLRSFSIRLFLSPFGLDEFVGALNCSVPNTLLDSIHVALMRALRNHFETLSSDGSELASKCIRCMDWSLLDTLTWPIFLVQYLLVMRYTEGFEWKGFYGDALDKDYYTLLAGRKLAILQILCDDVLDSAELRAEIDMREESEVGSDSDGLSVLAAESGPRRVHPRYTKTSACKGQEAVEIISESLVTKSSSNLCSLGTKSNGIDVDEDGNGDECRLCGMDGTLLCCDGCPSAYHSRCIGVNKLSIPKGAWFCPECEMNKTGPKLTRTTSLRGSEVFGVDLYEQVFLGTCDHLLVLKISSNSEPSIRYYDQNDIQGVLKALSSSVEHLAIYMGICKGILQYWEIPEDILCVRASSGLDGQLLTEKEDDKCSTQHTPYGKEYCHTPDMVEAENVASSVNGGVPLDVAVPHFGMACEETRSDEITLGNVKESDQLGQQTSENGSAAINCKLTADKKVKTAMSANLVQPDPSELTQQIPGDKSSMITYGTSNLRNNNPSHRGHMDGVLLASKMSYKSNKANDYGAVGCGNSYDRCLYLGLSFRPQLYVNHYVHGDFAASAAANLAVLSSEDSRIFECHTSSNPRKIMSANFSLQMKAFSLAAKRFFWPNYEKKVVEVPRERCGWCLSCRAAVTSKRGCFLNGAASNAIKGPLKILASLRPVKSGEGCLAGIATYVVFMEESLRGLMIGPFASSICRKQWRKEVEQAATLSMIKTLLLELEENIRIIALSTDWLKLVDDIAVESHAIQSVGSAVGSTQRRGPGGRRAKKLSSSSEVADDDGQDISKGFVWWRGGMLSKHLFQRGTLPQPMVRKAARQGGSRKIPGIHYADGFEVPRRSRQFVWRAAVEMSKNASQLALQVRYLDLHLRWGDLVRPEQSAVDGKGPETEVSAFRNAFLVDKKIVENKILYAVAFENQKHLPSRVMKSILETEQMEDGKEKLWFLETRIPLYLIKEYEENVDLPSTRKHVNMLPKLQRHSQKDIFSFLSRKRDNLEKCYCALCQTDLLIGNAVKCSGCQGYCHERCVTSRPVGTNEEGEFSSLCIECYLAKDSMPAEKISGSPTSPLLLQGKELRHELTAPKSGKQNGCKQPLSYIDTLQCSSERNGTSNASSLNTVKKRKVTLGLIWRKKKPGNSDMSDTGIDFRLKNILLKDNPDRNSLRPVCHTCEKPYDSKLMYICCQKCNKWYHADAVELTESKIFEVQGFKCCLCRRQKSPLCPYMDPDIKFKKTEEGNKLRNPKTKSKKTAETNKTANKAAKQANQGRVLDFETVFKQDNDGHCSATSVLPVEEANRAQNPKTKANNSLEANRAQNMGAKQANEVGDLDFETVYKQVNDGNRGSTSVLPVGEEAVYVMEDDSLILSNPVEQVTEQKSDYDFEWNAAAVSGSVPQKLPVRRNVKSEKEIGPSESYPSHFESSAQVGNILNPAEESLSPKLEWDVSMDGFEGDLMFDYEGLNYEDMEFEPQTYFSFTELLAPNDGVQADGVDPSGNGIGNWEESSAPTQDYNPEQYEVDITYDQQEPIFSVEAAPGDIMCCAVCSQTEPCPDHSCHICGLLIHRDCSPWVEESSVEGGWMCGNCREWR